MKWEFQAEYCQDLPIEFIDSDSAILHDGDDLACVECSVAAVANDLFYIGATLDVRRRWLGDSGKDGGRPLIGHHEKYDSMRVIGITDGKFGKTLETHLINYAKDQWSETCLNKAQDARGQTDIRHA